MDDRLVQIQKLLDAADGNLSSARTLVRELAGTNAEPLDFDKKLENVSAASEKVIEGVFDGEQMVAPDGKTYPVPPNYASKSKLVEGDTLKLTIADDGSFLFKQIAPVERRNAIGTLALTDGNYTISAEGKGYRVLTASVTFYKAEPGDQVTIILPKEHDAVWAVLENVIKKGSVSESETTPPVIPAGVVVPEPETSVIPREAEGSLQQEPALSESRMGRDDNAEATASDEAPDTTPTPEPAIEFPAGAPTISDEQLLENLKNNLKNLEQPAYTAPEAVTTPKPVDNIVANDLEHINQQSTVNSQSAATNDKPISELDI